MKTPSLMGTENDCVFSGIVSDSGEKGGWVDGGMVAVGAGCEWRDWSWT